MELIDKINSAQRREVIDEDKRIHKRALDSEFAFLKRIGEESLPKRGLEKYNIIKVDTFIQLIRSELEGINEDVQNLFQKFMVSQEEGSDFDSTDAISTSIFDRVDTNSGKAILYWNQLTNLIKTYNLSQADYKDIWDKIDDNIYPLVSDFVNKFEEIQTFYPDVYNLHDIKEIYILKNYIDNKHFEIIPVVTVSTQYKRPTQGESFETPQQQEENRIARERQRMATIGDELRTGIQRRGRIQEGMRQAEQAQGLPAGFYEPLGLGLGKPKKSKKKMDEDELEITMEVSNKIKDGKHQKNMKKAFKNLALPFDDSMDSNYLK